jgi:hypothetical protein
MKETMNYSEISRERLEGLTKNEKGNHSAEDVLNALLKIASHATGERTAEATVPEVEESSVLRTK